MEGVAVMAGDQAPPQVKGPQGRGTVNEPKIKAWLRRLMIVTEAPSLAGRRKREH
jgi:hypothetical protein